MERYAPFLSSIFHFLVVIQVNPCLQVIARKLIRLLGNVTKRDADNEVRALKKLCQNNHTNIIQVFNYGQLNSDGAVYFIDMELCDMSLENYLQGQELEHVSWAAIRAQEEVLSHAYNILQQILNGLIFIHSLHEVHRDLSPANGMPTQL